MSRAFVKEAAETFSELPDRPISYHPNLVTPEGVRAIDATVDRLQQEYAALRVSGDRAAVAAIAREQRYWISRKSSAQVVVATPNPETVQFGCTVTILRDGGSEKTYRIVGEDEADPAHGTISYVSPVAQALKGRKVQDVVQVGGSDIELIAIA